MCVSVDDAGGRHDGPLTQLAWVPVPTISCA